jgi:mRNA-degrading endonuclease RelE of RelBE toxin-antitoxin system
VYETVPPKDLIIEHVRKKYTGSTGIVRHYQKALDWLEQSPRFHPSPKKILKHEAYGGTHRYKTDGNHRIYYRIDDKNKQVVITRFGPKGKLKSPPKSST